MSLKALIIRFENAGIFPESKYSSDTVYDLSGMTKRRDARSINVSPGEMDWRHVSNMLHVLMNERPAATLRKTMIKPDKDIVALARSARVIIENQIEFTKRETAKYEGEELITARKSVKDAWQTSRIAYFLGGKSHLLKGGLLYWARLERFLGDALLKEMIKIVGAITNNGNVVRNISAHRALELLHDHYHLNEVQEFCKKCIAAQRKPVAQIINPQGNKESISIHQGNGNKLNALIVNSGPEKIVRISGRIFIPLEEQFLERVKNGTGVATLLEGGVAYIEDIEDWSENLIFDTKPVVEAPIV